MPVKKKALSKPSKTFTPYPFERHDDLEWQFKRFEKLLKRIKASELVLQAYAFALERHKDQERIGGAPYIVHPVRIANILIDEWKCKDEHAIAAALLHDVVEDTKTTIKEIKDLFGKETGDLVDGMTMWKGSETYEVYLKRVGRGPELLRLIKCADALDNLRSWPTCMDVQHKFSDWWKRADQWILPFAKETNRKAAKSIEEIINDSWYLKQANMNV